MQKATEDARLAFETYAKHVPDERLPFLADGGK